MRCNDDDEDKRQEEKLDKIELAFLTFILIVFAALLTYGVGAAMRQVGGA